MFKNEKVTEVEATIPLQEKPISLVAIYAKQGGAMNDNQGREEQPNLTKKV